MPRSDRTFSDSDIIRIIDRHLTPFERENVIRILQARGSELDPRILREAEEAIQRRFSDIILDIIERNPILAFTLQVLAATLEIIDLSGEIRRVLLQEGVEA